MPRVEIEIAITLKPGNAAIVNLNEAAIER